MAKLKSVLFAISLVIPLITPQCTIENSKVLLRRAVYDFSVQLVKRIAEETDYHFVTSALSPWTLISTISLGATDETLQEIISVLRLHRRKCFNKKYYEIIKELTAATNETILERSSNLFVDDKIPLNDDFRAKIQKTGVSTVESLKFENSLDVAATINDYVSRATRGAIDDIVSPSDLTGAFMVLIDALYFKGAWTNRFDTAETEESAFYDENENQIGDVNSMFAQQEANLANIDQIDSQILELTYGSQNRFSMLFILPNKGIPLSRVLENLGKISLKTVFSSFSQGPNLIQIQIPRFKISSDLDNMKDYLIDMGLKSMFDFSARLDGISQYPLYVSDFFQKANIEVTEEGTVASAATGAGFMARSFIAPIKQFILNRPFLFMIVDKHSEIALFTGAYSKPTVYKESI